MRVVPRLFETLSKTPITAVDVHPDGDSLVVGQLGDQEGQANLTLWSIKQGGLISDLDRRERVILQARFSPAGDAVAYVDSEVMKLLLYDIESNKRIEPSLGPAFVKWLSFPARDPKRLLLAGSTTEVWDLKAKRRVWKLERDSIEDPDARPFIGGLNPEGDFTAIGGLEPGAIDIFEIDGGRVAATLGEGPDHVRAVEIDSTGEFLAAMDRFGDQVFLWDLPASRRILDDRDELAGRFECLRFQPGGKNLAIGWATGRVELLSVQDGKRVLSEEAHRGRVADLAFSPDGKTLVSGGDDGIVHIWDLH